MKNIFLTIALFVVSLAACAQGSASLPVKKSITRTVQQLGIPAGDLKVPGMHAYTVKGQKVVMRVNDSKVVEHVGIPLFSQNIRLQMSSPVYDFLEYTLLHKKLSLAGDSIRVNSVTFKKGNWDTLLTITDDMQCTINCNMGRQYEVSWYAADKLLASLTLPVQYDLLMLSNKQELENIFIADLDDTGGTLSDYSIKSPDKDTFSNEYKNNNIFMLEGDTYLKRSITDNLFYRKKGQTYSLFSSSQYPAESLSNILLRADKSLPNAYVTLKVVKYDSTVKTIEFTMADWLACIEKYDCHCYYGFDKETDGKSSAVLYASNPKAGYDHVLMLECNTDDLDKSVVHLTGTAYLFSPTSNVKNMFFQYKKK